jgi:dihydrofolate reductase
MHAGRANRRSCPLGVGGEQLHEWALPLAAWRSTHGLEGGEVVLAGGAQAARQYLVAGLVDEMEIHLVPVLLGAGERLFDGVGDELHGLSLTRTVAAPRVTHLKFTRP